MEERHLDVECAIQHNSKVGAIDQKATMPRCSEYAIEVPVNRLQGATRGDVESMIGVPVCGQASIEQPCERVQLVVLVA